MINKPKKVIILGPAWPFRGGLATYNERLANEFERQAYQCEIITFTTQYPSFLFPGKTQYSEEASTFAKITRKLSSVNPISWITTARYINKQQPDLLITRYWIPFMGPCLGTVLRLLNKKITTVCLLDNVVPHEKRIGDVPFTKYFLAPLQNFVAMSKSVKEDLLTFKPKANCVLNPHPVFDNFGEKVNQLEAKQQLGLNEKNDYVLFFGFIRKYKGLDLAIKAFAKWKHELPEVKFVVAGEFYDNKEDYFNLAKKLGVFEDILWHTDFIPDSKVKYYFSACSLVLQPYYTATQSGVTQIAYQFQVPMIVTKVGGLPELVEHGKTGYLVEQDENEIANFVKVFFQNGSSHFEEHLMEAKKRFSWETLLQNFVSFIKK